MYTPSFLVKTIIWNHTVYVHTAFVGKSVLKNGAGPGNQLQRSVGEINVCLLQKIG